MVWAVCEVVVKWEILKIFDSTTADFIQLEAENSSDVIEFHFACLGHQPGRASRIRQTGVIIDCDVIAKAGRTCSCLSLFDAHRTMRYIDVPVMASKGVRAIVLRSTFLRSLVIWYTCQRALST